MTRRKPLWRTTKSWAQHEWVPMRDVWLRVYVALSEDMRLTRYDLKVHLLAGDLIGATRIIAPDGSERRVIFARPFWKPVEFPYSHSVEGYEYNEGETWFFFVRRRELDRLYPVTELTKPAPSEPSSSRRKPGPKIMNDWRFFAANAAYVFKEKHGRLPSGPELAQLCEDKLGYQPDVSNIARLLRFLLGE
jgi:hypothetical protein